MILNALFFLEAGALFAVLLIPAFLFAGVGPASIFMIQALAAASFALVVSRLILSGKRLEYEKKHRIVWISLLGFFPFLTYVLLQSVGGRAVFVGRIGSIAPFVTWAQWQQLICYLMLFVAFYDFFKTRPRVRIAALALALQITILAITGFYHTIAEPEKMRTLYGFVDMSGKMLYYASFLNPNSFGGYIVVSQVLFLASATHYWMSREEGFTLDFEAIEKFFLVLVIPLVAVSCVNAEARLALVWHMVILGLFFGVFLRRRPVFLLGMILGMVTLALYLPRFVRGFDPETISRDLAGKIQFMRESFGAFRDFPWFGTGLGTSKFILQFYQRSIVENWTLWQPYNTFLQLASETGIFGAALFLLPVGGFLFLALSASMTSSSRWNRVFGLAAFIAVFSYCVPGMFDNYVATPVTAVIMLFYAALLARCANNSFRQISPTKDDQAWFDENRSRAAMIGTRQVLFVTVWLVFAFFFVHVRHDYEAEMAVKAQSKRLPALERATKLRSWSAYSWSELGHWHYNEAIKLKEQEKDFRLSLTLSYDAYRKAVQAAPTWPTTWLRLSRTEILLGERERGSRHMDFALRLNPWNRDLMLYAINVQLNLAKATLWTPEESRFKNRAIYWLEASMRLKRPLLPNDCVYLRNWSVPLPEKDKKVVSFFISEHYRKKQKLLNSLDSDIFV